MSVLHVPGRPGLARRRPGWASSTPQDATSGDTEKITLGYVARKVFTNPVAITIAVAEFCTGFVRQGFEQWFPRYMQEVQHLELDSPVFQRNALAVVAAGIAGAFIAGYASDKVFGHRRPPVAFIGYALQVASLAVVWRAPSLGRGHRRVHRELARHLDGALDAVRHRLDGLRRQAGRGHRRRDVRRHAVRGRLVRGLRHGLAARALRLGRLGPEHDRLLGGRERSSCSSSGTPGRARTRPRTSPARAGRASGAGPVGVPPRSRPAAAVRGRPRRLLRQLPMRRFSARLRK